MKRIACALLPLLLTGSVAAADWPTLLGPTRDGVSTEKGIIAPWPKEGLKKLWECELGIGYAPPVVAGGRLFHFDRFGDNARLTCRDAATGKQLWKFEYPMEYVDRYGYEPGPRACPLVDGDRVYLHGVEGMVYCVAAKDGKELWKLNTQEKYHFHQNFFGVGSVPVVDGGLLIVPVGGSAKGPRPLDLREAKPNGTGFVALDKLTGQVKYATGDELASYSNPIIATINGKKTALYFARSGLVGFDPQTGKESFRFPWRAKVEESVNAANPVVVGDKVLLTECYGPGAAFIDLKGGKPKEIWTDAEKDRFDRSLACHWCTPIHVERVRVRLERPGGQRGRDALRGTGDRRGEVGAEADLPLHVPPRRRPSHLAGRGRHADAHQAEPGEVRGGVAVRGARTGLPVLGAAGAVGRHPLCPRREKARRAGIDSREEVSGGPGRLTALRSGRPGCSSGVPSACSRGPLCGFPGGASWSRRAPRIRSIIR